MSPAAFQLRKEGHGWIREGARMGALTRTRGRVGGFALPARIRGLHRSPNSQRRFGMVPAAVLGEWRSAASAHDTTTPMEPAGSSPDSPTNPDLEVHA